MRIPALGDNALLPRERHSSRMCRRESLWLLTGLIASCSDVVGYRALLRDLSLLLYSLLVKSAGLMKVPVEWENLPYNHDGLVACHGLVEITGTISVMSFDKPPC